MKSQILQYTSLYLVAQFLLYLPNVQAQDGCLFPHLTKGTTSAKMLQPIQQLVGKRYQADDKYSKYRYDVGICEEGPVPSEAKDYKGVGVLQTEILDNKKLGNKIVVGRYTNTRIMNGHDWVLLEYEDGDSYHSHCGKEKRRSRIFITCDETVAVGDEKIRVMEEFNNGTKDCYYLFEMQTSVTCQKGPLITVSLSLGSIIIIVFVCVVVLYIVGGFLYNRFVLGAKGLEQFPNYSFWQDFGNLQADGCNFVCRSGSRQEPRSYKGIGDDQLQEEDDRDDHLLPM